MTESFLPPVQPNLQYGSPSQRANYKFARTLLIRTFKKDTLARKSKKRKKYFLFLGSLLAYSYLCTIKNPHHHEYKRQHRYNSYL